MIYSVWDHGDRLYKYYETKEKSAATSAPSPKHIRSSRLGASPEDAAWPLPAGARLVGRGKYPKGYIASTSSGGNALGILPALTPNNVILYGVVGFLAWKFFLEPAMKGR